ERDARMARRAGCRGRDRGLGAERRDAHRSVRTTERSEPADAQAARAREARGGAGAQSAGRACRRRAREAVLGSATRGRASPPSRQDGGARMTAPAQTIGRLAAGGFGRMALGACVLGLVAIILTGLGAAGLGGSL